MNTIQILKFFTAHKAIKQVFIGVFAIDMMPPIIHYPSALIINLDFSSQPGSHWVGLFFDNKEHCCYFDTYGRKPCTTIEDYMLHNAISYTYNNIQVQDFFTTYCGQMSIYFLVWRAKGVSFKHIIQSLLSENIYKYFAKHDNLL